MMLKLLYVLKVISIISNVLIFEGAIEDKNNKIKTNMKDLLRKVK